jgi:Na+/melibiose symporter-like transporter
MRQTILILAGVCVFAVAAAVMVAIMPPPLKNSDYLVIGSIATLVSLLAMFVALIATRSRTPNPFFKKRRKKRD